MDDEVNSKAKQNGKTLQFWDSFYSNLNSSAQSLAPANKTPAVAHGANGDNSSDLEWIVSNSPVVLDVILSLFSNKSPSDSRKSCDNQNSSLGTWSFSTKGRRLTINILEIGCGVSQLSRSLMERLVKTREQDCYEGESSLETYSITATDVSSVCLEHNRARDSEFISSLCKNDLKHRTARDSLSYQLLDVLDESQNSGENVHFKKYDVILDKGTLDTFLFRSKRGKKGTSAHPPLLIPLLNNIHGWLRNKYSKYIIITPRSRIKSVRDFAGFSSVRRITLSGTDMGRMVLVEGEAGSIRSEAYVYECVKNDNYIPGKSDPFCSPGYTVDDSSICNKCKMTFLKFREGVDIRDQGEVIWARRWKGHRVHCKGDGEASIS